MKAIGGYGFWFHRNDFRNSRSKPDIMRVVLALARRRRDMRRPPAGRVERAQPTE
jgi:hypothetical protein